MNPYLITWEARYEGGLTVREREGAKYDDLDRSSLKHFALHSSEFSEWVLSLPVEDPGRFFYRRRTQMVQGGDQRVLYLLGFYPDLCLQFDPVQEHVAEIPADIVPLPFEPFKLSYER